MLVLRDALYVAVMAALAASITYAIYASAGISPW